MRCRTSPRPSPPLSTHGSACRWRGRAGQGRDEAGAGGEAPTSVGCEGSRPSAEALLVALPCPGIFATLTNLGTRPITRPADQHRCPAVQAARCGGAAGGSRQNGCRRAGKAAPRGVVHAAAEGKRALRQCGCRWRLPRFVAVDGCRQHSTASSGPTVPPPTHPPTLVSPPPTPISFLWPAGEDGLPAGAGPDGADPGEAAAGAGGGGGARGASGLQATPVGCHAVSAPERGGGGDGGCQSV